MLVSKMAINDTTVGGLHVLKLIVMIVRTTRRGQAIGCLKFIVCRILRTKVLEKASNFHALGFMSIPHDAAKPQLEVT